jgi:hypothetical protein
VRRGKPEGTLIRTQLVRRVKKATFRGEGFMRSLDLDNLWGREIPKFINGAWLGEMHSATRQTMERRWRERQGQSKSILRHADASTTPAYYILPSHERAQAGMKKLDKTLRTKYGIKA